MRSYSDRRDFLKRSFDLTLVSILDPSTLVYATTNIESDVEEELFGGLYEIIEPDDSKHEGLDELVKFAEKHKQVAAITMGRDNEGYLQYTLITPGQIYDDKFLDDVADLDLEINRSVDCTVVYDPIEVRDIPSDDLTGDIIWEAN